MIIFADTIHVPDLEIDVLAHDRVQDLAPAVVQDVRAHDHVRAVVHVAVLVITQSVQDLAHAVVHVPIRVLSPDHVQHPVYDLEMIKIVKHHDLNHRHNKCQAVVLVYIKNL